MLINASIVFTRPSQSLVLNNSNSFIAAVVLIHANKKAFGCKLTERTGRAHVSQLQKCKQQFHTRKKTKLLYANMRNMLGYVLCAGKIALACGHLHH